MNTIIIIGLIGIALALFIGFAIGNRKGIKEGREEMIKRFTKNTAKQLRRMECGAINSRN